MRGQDVLTRRRQDLMTSLPINKYETGNLLEIWRHWVNIVSYGRDVSADRRKYRVDERSSRWSEYLAAQISLSNDFFFVFMSRETNDSYRAAVRTWTEGILRVRQVRRYRRSDPEVVDSYWNRNYKRRKDLRMDASRRGGMLQHFHVFLTLLIRLSLLGLDCLTLRSK